MHLKLFFLLLTFLFSSTSHAFTIDGNWNDWLSPSGTGSVNDWIPNDSSVKYTVEDQDTSYLNPGYGGQDYDAEAIYVKRDASAIYVAVITGRNPDATSYPWGDIALDFGADGSFEYGLVTKGDSEGIGTAGEIYDVDQWNVGIWDAPGVYNPNPTTQYALQHPTSVLAGTLLGSGEFAYSTMGVMGTLGGSHYFMEAKLPANLFGSALLSSALMVHWTMGCANDWIQVDPAANVPEPSLPVLMLFGLLAMFHRTRTQHT